MLDVGSKELIIIGIILVLLFGSKKLPELAKGMAEAIRHLRRGFKDSLNEEVATTHETKGNSK
jgi:sec-independent protein translocase protein TatA